MKIKTFAVLLLGLIAIPMFTNAASAPLPDASRWIQHVTEDLAPFWLMEEARGTPEGNFPSHRGNDGKMPTNEPPRLDIPEHQNAFMRGFHCDFTRMKARQIFAYGVIYHMTGNEEAFYLMEQGIKWIREHALLENGDVISYWWHKTGKKG